MKAFEFKVHGKWITLAGLGENLRRGDGYAFSYPLLPASKQAYLRDFLLTGARAEAYKEGLVRQILVGFPPGHKICTVKCTPKDITDVRLLIRQ